MKFISILDDEGEQPGDGEEEKDSYTISNEVHFTSPKMTRYVRFCYWCQ